MDTVAHATVLHYRVVGACMGAKKYGVSDKAFVTDDGDFRAPAVLQQVLQRYGGGRGKVHIRR